MSERFDWFKPSPMWQPNGRDLLSTASQRAFLEPQLLEFKSDDFMDEFFAAAATGDGDELPLVEIDALRNDTLKLYQPAHGRYYLVCSSLCCVTSGFPDRTVRLADGESIFFVLRRLLDSQEWAWVPGGSPPGWQSLNGGPNKRLLEDEERLPLFTAPAGNGRSLVFGYLSVASRESYAAPPVLLPGGDETTTDPRLAKLDGRFISQVTWINQLGAAEAEIALRLSVYLMLDLWEYFSEELPTVAGAIESGVAISGLEKAAALIDWLQDQELDAGTQLDLFQAMGAVAQARDELNTAADEDFPMSFDSTYSLEGLWPDPASGVHPELETLRTRVEEALEEADGADAPLQTVDVPKLRQDTGERYVLRCVYKRPRCKEQTTWISRRSAEFQLAPFFDPDAPVRPLRITLPEVNTSNLRRFSKGVAFLMPNSLASKLQDVEDLGIDLNVSSAPGLMELGLGYFCTFSIPIITICAFILLLIIAIVLHLVFWWLPFLRICLPLPEPD